MPDLKYLYRVLYILINCFFKQVAGIFLKKLTIKSHIITLIIVYNSVVNVAEWLDRSLKVKKPSSGSIPETPKICQLHF